MNNRIDLTPELVSFLSQPRCASQLTLGCGQYNRATVVVPQPLDLRGVDVAACPYPVSRQRSNGVEVVTYPPDEAYWRQWRCRVARWEATQRSV